VAVCSQYGRYCRCVQVASNTKTRSYVNIQVEGTIVLDNIHARRIDVCSCEYTYVANIEL
jgi:hypothetical protein